MANAAINKDLNTVQKLMKQFPNMPPELKTHGIKLLRILSQGKQ